LAFLGELGGVLGLNTKPWPQCAVAICGPCGTPSAARRCCSATSWLLILPCGS